jgi:hypothetical protein
VDAAPYVAARRRLTTHSTGLAMRLDFIFNLNCSPVNSGVSRQKVSVLLLGL